MLIDGMKRREMAHVLGHEVLRSEGLAITNYLTIAYHKLP